MFVIRLFSWLIRKQFFEYMLEDSICEGGIDVSEGDADHLISLFMFRNLIDETVGEALCKTGQLLVIQSEQKGEENI